MLVNKDSNPSISSLWMVRKGIKQCLKEKWKKNWRYMISKAILWQWKCDLTIHKASIKCDMEGQRAWSRGWLSLHKIEGGKRSLHQVKAQKSACRFLTKGVGKKTDFVKLLQIARDLYPCTSLRAECCRPYYVWAYLRLLS